MADFVKQKIVVVGAGRYLTLVIDSERSLYRLLHWLRAHVTRHSVHPFNSLFLPFSAGLGVLNMAVQAVARMAGNGEAAAKYHFFLIDKDV